MIKKLAFTIAVLVLSIFPHITPTRALTIIAVEADGKTYYFDKALYEAFGESFFDVDEIVSYIEKQTYKAPKNARFYTEDERIKIADAVGGKRVNKELLQKDLYAVITAGGGCVKAEFIDVKPEYTREDLIGADCLRAEFSTKLSGSAERLANVKLATAIVGCVTVYPEEIFSFNDVVGKRTEENGYKSAKVIVGGKFVDGIGGGVCQVSTTLYNASLLSDLKIVEHHRHTLAVSYVEKSFDAMVSYGYADLKIKNETGAPVFIRGRVTGNKLTFTVYGCRQNKKIERQSVIVKTYEPTITVEKTDELPFGQSKVEIAPKKGYESLGYLIITENGEKSRVLIREDEYKKVDGVIKTGK